MIAGRVLSQGYPHVKTDFYIVGDNIYFGELTFFNGSGYEKTELDSFNLQLGQRLLLPC